MQQVETKVRVKTPVLRFSLFKKSIFLISTILFVEMVHFFEPPSWKNPIWWTNVDHSNYFLKNFEKKLESKKTGFHMLSRLKDLENFQKLQFFIFSICVQNKQAIN